MHHRTLAPALLLLLLAGITAAAPAAANTPPEAPVWLEPVPGDVVSAYDPHWNVLGFVDPDSGDAHLSSDFEVWDDSLNVRVWSALDTDVLVHIHLGDGVLEGPLVGESRLDFDRDYRVRARFRDDSGEPNDLSDWSVWVPFSTAPQWQPFPLLADDFADSLADLRHEGGWPIVLPWGGGYVPASMAFEVTGTEIYRLFGAPTANDYLDQPGLPEHGPLRVIVRGGTWGIDQAPTRLRFVDHDLEERSIYFPALQLAPSDSLVFWVDDNGSTYWGTAADTVPDFSALAQQVFVPWETSYPGYEIERVASNLALPVNPAFVPDPGPDSLDVLFYVTELYGKVKAVTNNGTVSVFADSLLNFSPTGDFPGSGEMGITGICVEPSTGDVFVSGAYDSLGAKYNRVIRLFASPDGTVSTGRSVVLEGIPSFSSHQIQMVSIGPDGKLYAQVGEAFGGGAVSQDPNDERGKVLRMELDGSPVADNPFGPGNRVFATGLRNPFGGAWRGSEGVLYTTDNGTNEGDRVVRIQAGADYGYCCDWNKGAIHVFPQRVGPTGLDFDDEGIMGSGPGGSSGGDLFVAWSGPTYALGQPPNGKRIWRFALDDTGAVIADAEFLHYTGTGHGTVIGIALGPDALYFTDIYGDEGFDETGQVEGNVYRVRSTAPLDTRVPEPPSPVRRLILGAPFPNPTASGSAVRFRVDGPERVRAAVFDVRGRLVRDLVDSAFPAGEHEIRWDGTTAGGGRAANGIYWLRLRSSDGRQEGARIVLLR